MYMVLDLNIQNVAERCEPKVFSPRGEERMPLRLLQCLSSADFGKPCCGNDLAGTEM